MSAYRFDASTLIDLRDRIMRLDADTDLYDLLGAPVLSDPVVTDIDWLEGRLFDLAPHQLLAVYSRIRALEAEHRASAAELEVVDEDAWAFLTTEPCPYCEGRGVGCGECQGSGDASKIRGVA